MRWIWRGLGLVVLVVVIVAGGLLALPGEQVARIAARQIEERTGRQVTFDGETSVSYYPVLGVRTGPVTLANAPWSDRGPIFRAQSVQIGVDAMALLRGEIRVTEIAAEAPEILLERDAGGRVNWALSGAAGAPTGGPGGPVDPGAVAGGLGLDGITLDQLRLRGARLRYVDATLSRDQRLQGLDLTLALPDVTGPADLTLALDLPGGRLTGSGRVARAADFLGGAPSALSLDLSAPGAEARFEGRGGLAPEADGRLEVQVDDPAALLAALGRDGGLPDGPLGVTGQVTFTPDGRMALRDTTLRAAGNRAAISADLVPGPVTHVTAQVAAGTLDLGALSGTGSGRGPSGGGSGGPGGWSTTPIDASALGLVEGEIALTADALRTGGTELGPLDTRITIDRSRAVAQVRTLSAYGGQVTGQLVANNRSGLSIGGDLEATQVDLKRLLRDLAGIDRFTGSAGATLDFLAVGNSVSAWMNALSGSGRISTGRGTIAGIDFDRVLRAGDFIGGTTIFDSASASFTIDDGVLRNDDLNMQLASVTASGEGEVDLGARRLDYLLTPVALRDESGRGLAIPVRVRGPWSDLAVLPDIERTLQLNSDLDGDALRDRARDELESGLRDALGIPDPEDTPSGDPAPAQSPEDALRDGLERKLQDELQKLFR